MRIDRSPNQLIVTMANGHRIPVRPDWQHLEEYKGTNGETRGAVIMFRDSAEWWMTAYHRNLIDGLGRDLADGEAFTSPDGCIWTRHGDELTAWTPGKVEALAA